MNIIRKKRVPATARIIGENLRNLRQRSGLSQKDLAKLLDITFQQVQKYERGENRFPVEKLYLLKNHFDVPYHVFFIGLNQEKDPLPWPGEICSRLAKISSLALQDRIERVVAIMLE